MGRSRVLSFISAFGGSSRKESPEQHHRTASASTTLNKSPPRSETPTPETPSPLDASPSGPSIAERRVSRPASTIFSNTPPLMEFAQDTPPELQPIFTYLNSHSNKLYHEGYFLKLNDLDTQGRPCPDRQWVECYAQLIGTALSLWDAAALDAAGEGEEVPPTFINLTDGSIKMIETLPTRNEGAQTLKNVLSLCSAGQNRYLFHFNSFHSLTQWTAAIRLAMYEHTSLQEAYTGSIIAGKGKQLNSIRSLLERHRFKYADWARVRFGAGTPWRRCWFVVSPPDEKEFQKAQKSIKKSAYDRAPRLVTGDIKFYETKKTKKVKPIATIKDAYCAYAIYPQSRALVDQSTMVKIEGRITIHSQPESTSEGFVFVMPETHPAVSGFEIMLKFLMPTFDTFNLYGRPTRLIAATNHIKSIMFAFPNEKRHGYLDVLDVCHLMQTPGSQNWSEAEWRKQLKEATAHRMANVGGSGASSASGSKPQFRASLPNRYSQVPGGPQRRPYLQEQPFNQSSDAVIQEVPRDQSFSPAYHTRVASDTAGFPAARRLPQDSIAESVSPASSAHDLAPPGGEPRPPTNGQSDRSSSDGEWKPRSDLEAEDIGQHYRSPSPPAPVSLPPAFTHGPGEKPSSRPRPSSDLRRANNRMSNATLAQLVAASGQSNFAGGAAAAPPPHQHDLKEADEQDQNRMATRDPYPTVPEESTLALAVSDYGPSPAVSPLPAADAENQSRGMFGAPLAKPPARQSLQLDMSKSVKRKPLPSRDSRNLSTPSPVGEPSYEDLRHTVDEEMLNWVGSHPSLPSPEKETQDEESVYDDGASTVSPDYASTHGSVYSKHSVRSVPRPRMGVKKTVGAMPQNDLVIGDARYTLDMPSQPNPDIPSVDFGPTLTYLPTTGRPTTSDTLKKNIQHHRTDSDVTERQRYFAPTQPMDREHSRSPSQDEYRRSMLWQPGMAAGRPVTPGGLTPEQFVQRRAAPSPPVHVHHRAPSTTPTPPPARPVSGDWTAPPRPHSRGASSMVNYNDISSHLSAREQEHVARMTGSSFFNLSSENKKPPTQVNPMGLVGAIDARERERKSMMEGMSNQMVQHAIAQRQQHWQQQQQPQQQAPAVAPKYATTNGRHSVYNMPTASHTWDALNQSYRPDEPRRQSWYGPLASSPSPQGASYAQSQYFSQHPSQYGNANAMHY
ncbi:hypothetical protein BDW42DRAFT_147584 [Aspergillus taichungensis]|uniref:PH domain-containing protein n=1 Tax=Aspergillus taichungensis TaxID=482145 RepID=A0A2J5HLP0_9EURO|nr:hypothetical protein BDW42DRAFT_147584 [Aspergillus taichungensis]